MVEIWGEYALHFKSDLAMAAHVVNPSHRDANQQANGSAMNAFYRICRRFFHGDDDIDNTACDYFAAVDGVLEQARGIVLAGCAWKNLDATPGHLWWQWHGSSTDKLRCLSMGLLSKLIGAGESERMWKKWKQTQTKQQNRMPHDRGQLAAECTELRESKKQKTTTTLVKSPTKKNKKKKQRKSKRGKK
jgi:hypothetical protein